MLQSLPLINEGNIVLHSWIDINFYMLKKKRLAINFDARGILMKSISSLTHDLVNQANMFRLHFCGVTLSERQKRRSPWSLAVKEMQLLFVFLTHLFLLVHDSAIMTFFNWTLLVNISFGFYFSYLMDYCNVSPKRNIWTELA